MALHQERNRPMKQPSCCHPLRLEEVQFRQETGVYSESLAERHIAEASLTCIICGQATMGGRIVVYEPSCQIVFILPVWRVGDLTASQVLQKFRREIFRPIETLYFKDWKDCKWESYTFEIELVKSKHWNQLHQEQQTRNQPLSDIIELDLQMLQRLTQRIVLPALPEWSGQPTLPEELDAFQHEAIVIACLVIWMAKHRQERLRQNGQAADETIMYFPLDEVRQIAEQISGNLLEPDGQNLRQTDSPDLEKLLFNLARHFVKEAANLAKGADRAQVLQDLFQDYYITKLARILANARELAGLSQAEAETLQVQLLTRQVLANAYRYYYRVPLRYALCSTKMLDHFIVDVLRQKGREQVMVSLNHSSGGQHDWEQQSTLEDTIADPAAEAELDWVTEDDMFSTQAFIRSDTQQDFLDMAGPQLATILRHVLTLKGARCPVFLYRMLMAGFGRDFFERLEDEFGVIGLVERLPKGPVPVNPLSLQLLLGCTGPNQVYSKAQALLDGKLANAELLTKRTYQALLGILQLRQQRNEDNQQPDDEQQPDEQKKVAPAGK